MKLLYDKPLIKGMIKSRPNRFIMNVELENELYKCHCPVTGKIGNIVFSDIPCLLSKSNNENRKTFYTVEAISLDNAKTWIGLNQIKTNSIIEFLFKTGQLNEIFNNIESVKREVKFCNSKFDFLVNGKHYVEAKTLLRDLSYGHQGVNYNIIPKKEHGIFYERLVRHLNDISENITEENRAIMLICFTYNAETFNPPKDESYSNKIFQAATKAEQKGVETWQINLKFDEFGVELIKYFIL